MEIINSPATKKRLLIILEGVEIDCLRADLIVANKRQQLRYSTKKILDRLDNDAKGD